MASSDPRREYVRNAIVDALALPSGRVGRAEGSTQSLSVVQPSRIFDVHQRIDLNASVPQDWLVQETYRFEGVLTAFLEDANVDLLACSIAAADNGQNSLSISNTADFSTSCTFQVGPCAFSRH